MTAELVRTSGHLTISPDQTWWTEAQTLVLKQAGIDDDVTEAELTGFLHLSQRTGLDPFSRQIYLIGRWDARAQRKVFTPQTAIDGYRVVRDRVIERTNGTLSYDDFLWCGPDGAWQDVWLDDTVPPVAAKVTVYRNGGRFSAVAKYTEYVQTKKGGDATGMWVKMPASQLAKCAEALALRKAFPHDLAGVYTAEEMAQADNPRGEQLAPERPARRQAAPAEDPWYTTGPAGQDVQDAEVVVGETRQSAPPSPMVPSANAEQINEILAGLRMVRGITEESSMSAAMSAMVRRDITHPKQLTKAEANSILETLRAEEHAKQNTPAGPAPNEDRITRPQMQMMQATFGEKGITDPVDKRAFASRIVGRTLESVNDLSKVEASRVIDALNTGEIPPAAQSPVARADAFTDLESIIANVSGPQSYMDAADAITEELAAGRINSNDADLLRERLNARVPQGVPA